MAAERIQVFLFFAAFFLFFFVMGAAALWSYTYASNIIHSIHSHS